MVPPSASLMIHVVVHRLCILKPHPFPLNVQAHFKLSDLKFGTLCAALKVTHTNAHRAYGDALALAHLLRAMEVLMSSRPDLQAKLDANGHVDGIKPAPMYNFIIRLPMAKAPKGAQPIAAAASNHKAAAAAPASAPAGEHAAAGGGADSRSPLPVRTPEMVEARTADAVGTPRYTGGHALLRHCDVAAAHAEQTCMEGALSSLPCRHHHQWQLQQQHLTPRSPGGFTSRQARASDPGTPSSSHASWQHDPRGTVATGSSAAHRAASSHLDNAAAINASSPMLRRHSISSSSNLAHLLDEAPGGGTSPGTPPSPAFGRPPRPPASPSVGVRHRLSYSPPLHTACVSGHHSPLPQREHPPAHHHLLPSPPLSPGLLPRGRLECASAEEAHWQQQQPLPTRAASPAPLQAPLLPPPTQQQAQRCQQEGHAYYWSSSHQPYHRPLPENVLQQQPQLYPGQYVPAGWVNASPEGWSHSPLSLPHSASPRNAAAIFSPQSGDAARYERRLSEDSTRNLNQDFQAVACTTIESSSHHNAPRSALHAQALSIMYSPNQQLSAPALGRQQQQQQQRFPADLPPLSHSQLQLVGPTPHQRCQSPHQHERMPPSLNEQHQQPLPLQGHAMGYASLPQQRHHAMSQADQANITSTDLLSVLLILHGPLLDV